MTSSGGFFNVKFASTQSSCSASSGCISRASEMTASTFSRSPEAIAASIMSRVASGSSAFAGIAGSMSEANAAKATIPSDEKRIAKTLLELKTKRSSLQAHPAEEIALAQLEPFHAQNIVRRRAVEMQVGRRETEQEVLHGEIERELIS